MTDPASLRTRLLDLRVDVLRKLAEAEHLDGGLLALLGNIAAALAALDAPSPDAQPAERAVLVDDGETIRLVVYLGANRVAVVELSAARAVGLAGELIAAASRRLR